MTFNKLEEKNLVENNCLSSNSLLYGILQGKEVYQITLQNKDLQVDITNIGCSITSIYTPDKSGVKKNIVAGFKDLKDYEINLDYFGCVLGRYANRIAGGRFFLNGTENELSINDGVNHLHGGFSGFNKKVWNIRSFIHEDYQVGVLFEYLSEDGEEGYPGNLNVIVKYILNNKNQLCIEYSAVTDKATPISLSNHSYFNLTGFENTVITDHVLQLNSKFFLEKNAFNVPSGNISSVTGTPLNFQTPCKIGALINSFPVDKGFDHCFILKSHLPEEVVFAAQLKDVETGRTLTVYTDRPAIHLYTANFWDGSIFGKHDRFYQKHGAVALETESYPDSPNHSIFPNTILKPGEHYYSSTIYEFGVE